MSTKEACASPSRGWIEDTDDALSLLTELNSAQELRIEEMRFIHDEIDCKMSELRCLCMNAMRRGDISISKYHSTCNVSLSVLLTFAQSA